MTVQVEPVKSIKSPGFNVESEEMALLSELVGRTVCV